VVPDAKKNPHGSKNWGPATGYYNLARQLVPDSGTAHNQLALIARYDGSNFSAIYHLYRALSVSKPFPETQTNLRVCFKKILKTENAGNATTLRDEQPVEELIKIFIRFHAQCYIEQE